ncbi:MAG: translesion DNA synthesis-associated protein ImuA [Gammaproteobacteria bacterium]
MKIEQVMSQLKAWCIDQVGVPESIVSTGFPELDQLIPEGGWPRETVIEILSPVSKRAPLHLLMPLLARLGEQDRWLSWIAPTETPYAPALAAAGVDLGKVQTVLPKKGQDALWTVEQSLASGASSIVLGWPAFTDKTVLRRTQEAAEEGETMCILFRPDTLASEPSQAILRLQVDYDIDGSMLVTLLKRSGGPETGPVRIDFGAASPLAQYSFDMAC